MLKGRIAVKYMDDDKIKAELYNAIGADTSVTCQLRLSTNSYRAIELMAGDGDDNNDLDARRVDINLNSVKVERKVIKDDSGKVISAYPYNEEFFCRLGAFIRYIKTQCKPRNAVDYTGLAVASGEFIPETVTKYEIMCGNYVCNVSLSYGEIQSLHIENDTFKIDLDNDPDFETRLYRIENSTPKSFRFDFETLEFIPDNSVVNSGSSIVASGTYKDLSEVMQAHPEKELAWLMDKQYVIVTDDTLDEVMEYFNNAPEDEFIYCDTETTGLNITFKSRIGQADQCVGIILSYEDGVSYYFPMQMKSIPNLCNGDHFFFVEHYLRKYLETRRLVGHNISFDWKVLYIYDVNANFVEDTMAILALTLGVEKEEFPLNLKDSSAILLGRDSLELGDLVYSNQWGENDIKFWDLPPELVRLYACADTDNTRGIHKYAIANDLLQRYNATRVYRIEVVFSLAVGYQEFYGHRIDVTRLDQMLKDINAGLKDYMAKMVEIVGHDFNPNSPKQLCRVMYEELGIPEQYSRKTGRLTTDKDTLKNLASLTDINDNQKYPFVGYLVKYREFEGIRKIAEQFDKFATVDGFVFSDVMQYGTTTGRVSIKQPNYQSYNDAVKKYVCPRTGFYMADTDYSSVEYRVTGNMSGNKMIKEGFVDPDFDYHTYQAARMYNVPYSSVTPQLRKAAKGFNFGIPYGMGDESLGVRIFGEATPENTKKAAELHKKYFAGGQEDIELFFESTRDKAEVNGYTETYFGRRRYYHAKKFSRGAIRRQAGNAVIQGTSADIYKLAVGRMFLRVCKEGLLGKILFPGFIHDELLLEVHESVDPMVFLRILREEFEVKIEGWCPLYMGFGFGMSWYQAKKTELPIQLQWELVEKYGTEGYPRWNGDGYQLCNDIDEILRDFSIRHVGNQLMLETAQGKEIKPALNSSMLSVLKEDDKLYNKIILNYLKEQDISTDSVSLADLQTRADVQQVLNEGVSTLRERLNTEYISNLVYTDDGLIGTDFLVANGVVLKDRKKDAIDTQVAIDIFCKCHDYDRSKINVLSINTEVKVQSQEQSAVADTSESEDTDMSQFSMDARVDTLGMYVDTDNNIVTLKYVPSNWLSFIKERVNREGKGYLVRFKDSENQKLYITNTYLASENISIIQQMYIEYFKSIRVS